MSGLVRLPLGPFVVVVVVAVVAAAVEGGAGKLKMFRAGFRRARTMPLTPFSLTATIVRRALQKATGRFTFVYFSGGGGDCFVCFEGGRGLFFVEGGC